MYIRDVKNYIKVMDGIRKAFSDTISSTENKKNKDEVQLLFRKAFDAIIVEYSVHQKPKIISVEAKKILEQNFNKKPCDILKKSDLPNETFVWEHLFTRKNIIDKIVTKTVHDYSTDKIFEDIIIGVILKDEERALTMNGYKQDRENWEKVYKNSKIDYYEL